jgi:hypothetical protein
MGGGELEDSSISKGELAVSLELAEDICRPAQS